jgi:phosphatidylserine/phosphatidylglycerophosphate/cardiolipin synthase-like enzyme
MLDHPIGRFVAVDPEPRAAEPPTGLVASLPAPMRGAAESRLPGLLPTARVFQDLLAEARSEVKIFSPYVDPSFTGCIQACRVPVSIVTTLRDTKPRTSPVLERLASERPLAVRYLHEMRGKAQLFQMHAKMILSDHERAYLGSANFTDTSLHYNLELGVRIEDRAQIDALHRLFDYVFESVARPCWQG